MTHKFDVIIVGAGPAGVTAAGVLAGTGISVALLEAGVYAGAENWSGCVYFAENLADRECFGPEAVAGAPFERAVVRRGTLMHNGLDVVGMELSDAKTFRNCYTVLRPVFDPYFAGLARAKGAVHLPETTVTGLIRKDGRVRGVETSRGPLHAGVIFLAEGDASHLVRSEKLERKQEPHFLQGVKAVLSLDPETIQKRFALKPSEGAAYELLFRNPLIAGRTARLNAAGFLYTNRESLSLGYVVPLDNMRNHYRGNHDSLYEWISSLPYIRELVQGATLSAYGAKIIRSGGWRERPVFVQDGLAVGGAATGLGVDIPFPNFTGPASASGLYFARAVKKILERGSSFDAGQLNREYVAPLLESAYGRNARYLSLWPGYFSRSTVLFGRTVDIACGAARFLSSGNMIETGRFLRSHILSFKGIRELVTDAARAAGSLRLWKPALTTLISPVTLWRWTANLFRRIPPRDPALGVSLHIGGRNVDAATLPWPAGPLIARLSPAILRALRTTYANDGRPAREKFAEAVRDVIQGLRLSDLVLLPAFGFMLFIIALGTALWDAFRFFVLRTPVETLLAEPVMAHATAQKKARDLDAVKPSVSLDAKLATNTYRVGSLSHIRTLWPASIPAQPDMSRAGLWRICPARVYGYEPPPFSGRGRVTVNFENCIKCESCWRSEPSRALWGRHTGHGLIYRPESAAFPVLLDALRKNPAQRADNPLIPSIDERLWYMSDAITRCFRSVMTASAAFRESVAKLPHSADKTRQAWPVSIGRRLADRLGKLEAGLANDGRNSHALVVGEERKNLELCLEQGELFHALYSCMRIEQRIAAWSGIRASAGEKNRAGMPAAAGRLFTPSPEELSDLFPDRVVKQWEDAPIPGEWSEKVRSFIAEHRDVFFDAVRMLSSRNPALGLIAAHQIQAARLLAGAGFTPGPGVCAVRGEGLGITEISGDDIRIKGTLPLVPAAASDTLLILSDSKGYLVPMTAPGLSVAATPAIGFRAAGLSDISLDCTVKKQVLSIRDNAAVPHPVAYLSLALGAADYLSRRVREHASTRVQFSGQMLDTQGRDGIAKLGAVKALIARTEAWRLLLETLYEIATEDSREHNQGLHDLCSALAAAAFSPEPGALGYDAGQVFGGFAYSEDDLLSRFYRDSALFRFLAPGCAAAARLHARFKRIPPDEAFNEVVGNAAIPGIPLSPLLDRWTSLCRHYSALPAESDGRLAGVSCALLFGIRAVLARAEQGLESGRSMEGAAAAAEVLLGLAEDAVMKAELSSGRGTVSPDAVFPAAPVLKQVNLDEDYESFCRTSAAPHKSGGFLASAFDRSSRFVPEMQLHDVKLRARWSELVGWFQKNCSEKQFDGFSIERSIEKTHRLPDEIVRAARENRWLATYIPQSLDGLGWHKAEYYILNSAAGSFGDASIDLLIMANTSIGTTPILLGLEDELPRVREELAPLVEDERKLGDIGSRLSGIIGTLSSPNPGWIRKEYETVMQLVDSRIRQTRVVKYLAANFLKAFYGAGIAGRRGDFGGFIANLEQAGRLFTKLIPDVHAALEELPRRERCHTLFLRYLGHGAVSAFALTEPTAGSDSGGIKTIATPQSAGLSQLDDGRYAFSIQGGEENNLRYLIDADRIVLVNGGIAYRTPDGGTQPIMHDQYDYAADQGVRYYTYKGSACPFHDIGQVRKTNAGFAYEYYSLTGAKMWITNGSIATQFCLYAQAPEGVTGFMVDRHAEGLRVGADEKKMGQRGSPTNEISLDSVRVPREAVIGYEGHGQVNALETLNVGRCGLAVVSGALMRKLMMEATAAIPPSPDRDNLLGEAAAVLFGSESLAYYLVGLFDRPHESVRMESAIAKYACSEDIHEFLTLVEYAFGPEGQTEKHLLEKARRDSRILTIYEGTNEVQRFLILKDLIAQAGTLPELPEQGSEPERTLAQWKNKLRRQVKEAAGLLGDIAWSDAMLQPALFPLSEMAGEILKLECIYYRMEWLEKRASLLRQSSPDYVPAMLAAGRRAADRCTAQLRGLEKKYASAWELVKSDRNMPEVRAADAALDLFAEEPVSALPGNEVLQAPIRVLSIIRPVADLSPRPRITGGNLEEVVWRIDPSDLAALSQICEIKSASDAKIVIHVLMPGGVEHEHILRMTAGTQADDLRRLAVDAAAGPEEYLKIVRDLDASSGYDLIMTGADCLNGDGSLGAYLAGSLGRNHYRRTAIEVNPGGTGLQHIVLPAVVSITASVQKRTISMDQVVESALSAIGVITPERREAPPSRFGLPAGAEKAAQPVSNPVDAAAYLKDFAASECAADAPAFSGHPASGALHGSDAIWAILDPQARKSNLAVLRALNQAAEMCGRKAHALLPAPRETWPGLLGLARANGCEQAFCIDTGQGRLSNEGKRDLIRAVMKISASAIIFAGTEWAGSLAYVAGGSGARTLLCSGLTGIAKRNNSLLFSLPAYDGRLVRNHVLDGGPAFITVSPEADFPPGVRAAGLTANIVDLAMKPDMIMPLAPVAPPALAQADVIIDVGYGIRDKSGFAMAEELKKKLEILGLAPLFGATRKVTQDLKLLPLEAQIGQTGVRVNPKLIIALGISGAPQHIDYIGTRADILCFNKDAEAPLMKLNLSRKSPRVHPISGDMFVTVLELIRKLG